MKEEKKLKFVMLHDGTVFLKLTMTSAETMFIMRGGTLPQVYVIHPNEKYELINSMEEIDEYQEHQFGLLVGTLVDMEHERMRLSAF